MKRFLLSVALLLACSGVALAQESEFSGGGGGGITTAPGSGTAGRVPQFVSATSLADSKMTTSGTNSGTWTLYDDTAVTGTSRFAIRSGAADAGVQSNQFAVYANDGTTAILAFQTSGYGFQVGPAGSFTVYGNSGNIASQAGFGLYAHGYASWSIINPHIKWPDGSSTVGLNYSAAGILAVTDGSTGQGGIGLSDAATNTVSDALILRHATSGTAAASFGTGLLFQGEDAAGNMQDMASIDAVYTDATNGSEDADVVLRGFKAGAELEFMRFREGYMGTVASISINSIGGSIDLRSAGNLYISPAGLAAGWVVNDPALAPYYTNTYDIGTSSLFVRNNYVSTSIQGTRTKTLTDNTITDVVQISSATTDRVTAGHVSYTVYASDATNHLVQTETGEVPFLLVNENGTVTVTLGTVYGTAIDSAGGAALTNTFASSVSGTDAKIRVTSNYDQATLTGTVTHTIEYRVYIDSGTATVTPQ